MYVGEGLLQVLFGILLIGVLMEMICKGLGMIVVFDEYGKFVGIFIDGDLCCVLDWGIDVCQVIIDQVMIVYGKIVCVEIFVVEVLKIMEDNKIGVLVVVDVDDCLVGVLNMYDLLCVGVM